MRLRNCDLVCINILNKYLTHSLICNIPKQEKCGSWDLTGSFLSILHLKSSPDICREVNLITLLISEDEGSHRHVINVLSDPVHLGHHPVHFVKVLTCR